MICLRTSFALRLCGKIYHPLKYYPSFPTLPKVSFTTGLGSISFPNTCLDSIIKFFSVGVFLRIRAYHGSFAIAVFLNHTLQYWALYTSPFFAKKWNFVFSNYARYRQRIVSSFPIQHINLHFVPFLQLYQIQFSFLRNFCHRI